MIDAVRRRIARPFRKAAKKAQAQQQWEEALLQLKIANRIHDANLAIVLQIGNMHTELGQYELAEKCFKRVAASKPFLLRGLIGMAGLAERRHDWPDAVERWEGVLSEMAQDQAVGSDPAAWAMSPAMALVHCALGRERIGDQVGAERDLMLAFALQPEVRRSREAVLMRAGMVSPSDLTGAFRILRAAHHRYPADPTILSELARAALRIGRREEARSYVRCLVALAPSCAIPSDLIKEV